jgi:glutamate dehydrogenase
MKKSSASYAHTLRDALDAIVAALPEGQKNGVAPAFIQAFYRSATLSDVQEISPELAAHIAVHTLRAYHNRTQTSTSITIDAPAFLTEAFKRKRLAVTIINRDMPFLVDTMAMALGKLGFTLYRTIHPQLWVKRDAAGNLLEVHNKAMEGTTAESCMYVELSPLPEGMSEDAIRDALISALSHVQFSVEDWRIMQAKLREVGTHIAAAALPQHELEEAAAFFDWLLANNFIFMGYVAYDFYDANGKEALIPVSGSELGVFRMKGSDLLHRGLVSLPPEVQHFVHQQQPVEITKSNRHSVVHRDVLMDYIGVKRYDAHGKVIGESRFLGLFTSTVYYQKTSDIPYIRAKVQKVLDAAGFDRSGHSGKALRAVLEFFPRDELFQIDFDTLLEITLGVVSLEERPNIRAFFRRDRFERFVSCFVYLPRDKFNSYVREEVAKVLQRHLDGTLSTFYSQLTDSPLARVNYIIQTTPAHIPPLNMKRLNDDLGFIINYWVDSLRDASADAFGDRQGEALYRAFARAFPKGYINSTAVLDAIADMLRLKAVVETGTPSFYLADDEAAGWHLKMYAHSAEVPLSDILPMIEHFGFKVRDVVPYAVTPEMDGVAHSLLIRDFSVLPVTDSALPFAEVKPLIEQALAAVWQGDVADDALNALTTHVGLTARQVMVLRAYVRYAKQAGLPYSEAYVIAALCKHASIASALVRLFEHRFDPAREAGRAANVQEAYGDVLQALSVVENLSEDRILRFMAETMQATLRTNVYQMDGHGAYKPYLSFKLDSALVPNLPLPRPWREIFVYSMTTEGIHLRGGKVARGGLRWSDRHEDFRTEVLGLMKAQIVKNTVIVPTGSKGGFVVKTPQDGLSREEKQAAGVASYKQFLSGLLDVTDNRAGDTVVPPASVVRYDEDDPYLVVAADKGTATFSDIANGVSLDYGFWLGDAFASGGSVGYDHKKMGITARGAWISVQRHFLEMGQDIASEDFTVAGIGDMSGDVFGNGMLLSPHIRLLAAFNHLHIFIDPNPDAEASFTERQRLFDLGRGSWDAYNAALISKGGGVFLRSAKSIALTPQMQAMLGVQDKALAPNDLIRLILKMPVDLLWNGGIGTYVKASTESHEEVGDASNNGLRINGDELRARVVGEGGNLGMTQRGRTEYARLGGRLNTDAIDNSAGVDCSDHEVNIKIALKVIEERTGLSLEARNTLLEAMTENVATLVLRDNQQQNKALSIAEARASEMVEMHGQFMRALEAEGLLNRAVEFLPTDKQLADLKADGCGLTRPELAVLLAYSKILLYQTLAASKLVSSDIFVPDLLAYFPRELQDRYREDLLAHPLRREIVATVLTNEIVNRAGITYIQSIHQDTGHDICNIVRVYGVIRDVFALSPLWEAIEALQRVVDADTHIALFTAVTRFLRRMSVWFLSNSEHPPAMETLVKQYGESITTFVAQLDVIVSPSTAEIRSQQVAGWVSAGVPEALAANVANLDLFLSACDIAMLDHASSLSLPGIGRLYYELGSRLHLSWLRQFINGFAATTYWDRLAMRNAVSELYDEQRRLTQSVLQGMGEGADWQGALDAWLEHNQGEVERFARLIAEIRLSEKQDMAMMIVALRQLSAVRGR